MESLDKDKLLKRLMLRTRITNDGHYLWLGKISKGHGHIKIGGRYGIEHTVSRVSAFIYLGLDLNDKDQHALHKKSCPYKNCWCSNCLYIGTHKDNMRDTRKEYCTRGHLYSGCNLGFHRDGTKFCRTCRNRRNRNYSKQRHLRKRQAT